MHTREMVNVLHLIVPAPFNMSVLFTSFLVWNPDCWLCPTYSVEQLKALVADIDRKIGEDQYSSASYSKEKDDLLDSERSRLANTMAEISEEQSRKLLKNEIKLREDAQTKFLALEKVIICTVAGKKKKDLSWIMHNIVLQVEENCHAITCSCFPFLTSLLME